MSDKFYDVIQRRTIEDIFYHIPFIPFFHKKCETNCYENVVNFLPNLVKKSNLFAIMVFLNTKNVVDAIEFAIEKNIDTSNILYEYEIFKYMESIHKRKLI